MAECKVSCDADPTCTHASMHTGVAVGGICENQITQVAPNVWGTENICDHCFLFTQCPKMMASSFGGFNPNQPTTYAKDGKQIDGIYHVGKADCLLGVTATYAKDGTVVSITFADLDFATFDSALLESTLRSHLSAAGVANAAVTAITFRSGSVIADIGAADAAAVAAIQGLSIQAITLVLSAAAATPTKWKELGVGSCSSDGSAHAGKHTYREEADNKPETCFAACIQEYGDDCAGFDTRSGVAESGGTAKTNCVVYTLAGDAANTITTTKNCETNGNLAGCDTWASGTCYALTAAAAPTAAVPSSDCTAAWERGRCDVTDIYPNGKEEDSLHTTIYKAAVAKPTMTMTECKASCDADPTCTHASMSVGADAVGANDAADLHVRDVCKANPACDRCFLFTQCPKLVAGNTAFSFYAKDGIYWDPAVQGAPAKDAPASNTISRKADCLHTAATTVAATTVTATTPKCENKKSDQRICNGVAPLPWNFAVSKVSREQCAAACVANVACDGYAYGKDGTIDAGDCRLCTGANTVNLHDRYEHFAVCAKTTTPTPTPSPDCTACAAEFSSKGGCNFYDAKQGEFTGNPDSLIPAGCMPCVAVAKALCSAGPTPPSGEQAAAINRMAAQLETVVQEIADMKADVKDIKTGMENFDAKWDTFLNAAGCPRTKTRFRFRRAGLGP